jgi:acyl-CoA synthetase (AMP-forming)/AMP-acid ligase II
MPDQPTSESPIQFLRDRFSADKNATAFIFDGNEFTYGWALDRIDHWLSQIEDSRIPSGSVVAMSGDYSPDICCLLSALIDYRAVAVPFASVTGKEKEELLDIAQAGYEFVFRANGFSELKVFDRPVTNPLLTELIRDRSPGLVVFSSGSTGRPKGILHDFSRILEKFRVRRKTLRTLTFLQLDHLGGINTLLYVLSNGGTVISVGDRSPPAIGEAVERYQIELLPVTPSFLNLFIVSDEFRKWNLSSLKIISYGTEVMPQATLEKVKVLFPGVGLQQTYGLSELGVLRTKSRDDGSLWVKVGGEGFETKVVDGILWIKAKSAMLGYLNAPQPFDADGWFNTDDQVEVDGEYLKILGRQSEIINVGGQKVFPAEVEDVLIQIDNIKDAVVFGEKNFLMGNIVAAKVNLIADENDASVKKRVREFCKRRLSAYKVPVRIEISRDDLFNSRFKRIRGE